ncbi:FkbM family methyltransferase [Aestuariicoccus sp. MJ-SS9]|uniref:FkbM family methyltransferase n=1 Tax=Aestuariicoccus sp. MJ-SS9 TaxID=3079855 RepID=UPI002907E1E9|nr:FkbM family methyltransferase [Aestuariicoccus sp. MJ-SS9]MDU8914165.1 FkbM family methyltransferase [Aestuariicoccus sp. MJ-SS9]
MVDVGAHFGSSLLPFARAGWQVVAFEPDAANRARLERNLAAEPKIAEFVEVLPVAVSDTEMQDVPLYGSPISSGISGLSAFHESHAEVDRVSTTTLNKVLAKRGIKGVDFLKIDVEGHEMPVLRGFDLEGIRPRAVLAEFEDAKTLAQGYSAGDLAEVFARVGYTVFVSEWHPIERYGKRHSWSNFRRWPCDIPGNAWGNFVAFREAPGRERLERGFQRAMELGKPFHERSPGAYLFQRIFRSTKRFLGGA